MSIRLFIVVLLSISFIATNAYCESGKIGWIVGGGMIQASQSDEGSFSNSFPIDIGAEIELDSGQSIALEYSYFSRDWSDGSRDVIDTQRIALSVGLLRLGDIDGLNLSIGSKVNYFMSTQNVPRMPYQSIDIKVEDHFGFEPFARITLPFSQRVFLYAACSYQMRNYKTKLEMINDSAPNSVYTKDVEDNSMVLSFGIKVK